MEPMIVSWTGIPSGSFAMRLFKNDKILCFVVQNLMPLQHTLTRISFISDVTFIRIDIIKSISLHHNSLIIVFRLLFFVMLIQVSKCSVCKCEWTDQAKSGRLGKWHEIDCIIELAINIPIIRDFTKFALWKSCEMPKFWVWWYSVRWKIHFHSNKLGTSGTTTRPEELHHNNN